MEVLFRTQDDAERSDDRDSMSDSTTPSRTIVEHRPSWSADAVRDDLRLTEPKIPVLDARDDRNVVDSVSLCPFQRGSRTPVFWLAGAYFFDDGVRNQDCGARRSIKSSRSTRENRMSGEALTTHAERHRGVVAMTFDERVQAVAEKGFTERQARFLMAVMLHAGVCVPRQYARFCGIVHGDKTRKFFAKLVRLRYASMYDCRHNRARIYHVNQRALYAAIGAADSTLRRPLTLNHAIQRLMVLDAIVEDPEMI